ncbi:MAG: sigma-70 family RNA polymerase sigma factor [Pedobacter sp.]|nr:MAG: sigma-70 family RNA polymerase sigma factor [Pedobacter sp.]
MKPAANELTAKLRNGDQDALFSLMTLYYNDLFRYGIKYTVDKELTKDIIGQFFLHVWDHRDKFSAATNIQGYLLISFKRFLINYLRKISRELKLIKADSEPVQYSYEDYIIAWQQEESVRASLLTALQSLPPRQQELIQLKYYEQLSYEEIATRTSLSIRTVYNKLHEAVKKLRTHASLDGLRKNFFPAWLILLASFLS